MKDKDITEVKTAAVHERLRLKQLRKVIVKNGFNQAQSVTVDGKRYHKLIKTMHDISRLIKSLGKLIKLCEELQDERRDKSNTLPA